MILQTVKKFYWDIRITKGRNIISAIQSIFFEVIVKFTPAKKSEKTHKLNQHVYISLTSYPPRFKKLALTLKCLINQNVSADKILLWVAEEDFKLLPKNVLNLAKQDLIQIKKTEDLGPGKKLIPALQKYPEAYIVTADDDLYFKRNWLEGLINSWDGCSKTVVAHRVHRIKLDSSGKVCPYLNWDFDRNRDSEEGKNFATCGAGALFPPNCFFYEVTNVPEYLKYCHFQDDIWFNWMIKLNHGKIIKSDYDYSLTSWIGSNETGLFNANSDPSKSGNDRCIKLMSDAYGVPFL